MVIVDQVRWLGRGVLPLLVLESLVARGAAAAPCDIVALSGGTFESFALQEDGTLWWWGVQQPDPNTESDVPQREEHVQGVAAVHEVWLGVQVVLKDGTVWGWGKNDHGVLGDGTTVYRADPVQAIGLRDVVQVAGREGHRLALTASGQLWAWGWNYDRQLGDGTQIDSYVPIEVPAMADVRSIAVEGTTSAVIRADGTVWAWGDNTFGQLGRGYWGLPEDPAPVPGLSGAVSIAIGDGFMIAALADGSVWAWGVNGAGQLGTGTQVSSWTPVRTIGLPPIAEVAAGDFAGFALAADGGLWAWGANTEGELCTSAVPSRGFTLVPVQTDFAAPVLRSAHLRGYTLAQLEDGTVWACGYNILGQLGDGTRIGRWLPVRTLLDTDAVPGDQGNRLRAIRAGADVALDFAGAPAAAWRVYRDTDPLALGTTALVPDVTARGFVDPGAIARGGLDYYRVKGLSACSGVAGP